MSRQLLWAGSALMLMPVAALGAGIERTPPSSRILFEDGRYIEFSYSHVTPTLEGDGGVYPNAAPAAPNGTGNLLDSYAALGFGYKADLNDQLSYAIIVDESAGVDTYYPSVAGSGYAGTQARLNSLQITGILAYDLSDSVKLYGGLRAERMDATATLPFFGTLNPLIPFPVSYDVDAEKDWSGGYLIGAAYARPDIALRIALTYYSRIDHTLDTTETVSSIAGTSVVKDSVDISMPESVNLEFQTGIVADTLLFGSVRWVNWSEFEISPTDFTQRTGQPLVDYQKDWITYTLGVGRKFTDNWSGSIQASWEPAADYVPLTTLGPIDGRRSIGVAAIYSQDHLKVTTGLSYFDLGKTENFAQTKFDDGHALGIGVRVGYTF